MDDPNEQDDASNQPVDPPMNEDYVCPDCCLCGEACMCDEDIDDDAWEDD